MNKFEKHIYENCSTTIFPGYYNSELYDSEREAYEAKLIKEEHGKDYELKNWKGYTDSINKDIVLELACLAPKTICKNFNYKGMWSPQYYNYNTDKIQIEMELNKKALYNYIKKNKEEFFYYIHEHWKSRSGYISFIPQTFEKWKEEFNNNEHIAIDIALDWIFLTKIADTKHLDQDTMYEIRDGYYYETLHEISDNALYEHMEEA